MSRHGLADQRQALWSGRGLPGLARWRAPPSIATGAPPAYRSRRSAAGRSGRCRMRRCWRRSAPCWPPARSTARGTARSGHGCACAGVRTSKRRVLRLMRENDLLAPSRVGSPRGPRNHDGTIIPETVDTMWGTDLTTTITGEGQVAVFIAVDHCSRRVRRHPCRPAGHPLRGARADPPGRCGGISARFAKDIARGLAVRHDHGSQYMSDAFQKELAFLGIESSPAFVRAPGGQRLRRALHPNPEGEPPLGADLRHGRGPAAGAARLPRDLQHHLADRAARLPTAQPPFAQNSFHPRPSPRRFNSVSQKPRAVQRPTAALAKPALRSAGIRIFTMAGGHIRALTGRRRIRPISTGGRKSRRPEPGRIPLTARRSPVQTSRATSQHPRRSAPLAIDAEMYKWRHLIENYFAS